MYGTEGDLPQCLFSTFGLSLMQYQVDSLRAPPEPGQHMSTDLRAASYYQANASCSANRAISLQTRRAFSYLDTAGGASTSSACHWLSELGPYCVAFIFMWRSFEGQTAARCLHKQRPCLVVFASARVLIFKLAGSSPLWCGDGPYLFSDVRRQDNGLTPAQCCTVATRIWVRFQSSLVLPHDAHWAFHK